MIKFGCLTWWRNNYGSILQAYALQQKINSISGMREEIICQYGKKINSSSNFVNKIKAKGLKNTLNRVFWKFCVPNLRRRSDKIQKFVDANLIVSDKEYNKDNISVANEIYDGFICGSDQIWNPKLVSLDSMYWLGFAEKGKIKIAYAPSMGVESVSEKEKRIIKGNLSSFKAVSSREETGTKLLNEACGETKCVTVLDPTMLVDRRMWDNICPKRKFDGPYLFVYMLRGTKRQRKWIEQYAKARHLKIVTMPFLDTEKIELYDLTFGDIKYWDADPADFISVIRYAECVITDSFHSTVFSCLYHTDFLIFPKIGKAQVNRLTSLQSMLEIPNRIIDISKTIADIDGIPKINWENVDSIIEERKRKSNAFLIEALTEQEIN